MPERHFFLVQFFVHGFRLMRKEILGAVILS